MKLLVRLCKVLSTVPIEMSQAAPVVVEDEEEEEQEVEEEEEEEDIPDLTSFSVDDMKQ